MGELVPFNGVTRLDIDIGRVLDCAKESLKGGVVIGWDQDGEFYFASSYADGGEVLWLLRQAERALLSGAKVEPRPA